MSASAAALVMSTLAGVAAVLVLVPVVRTRPDREPPDISRRPSTEPAGVHAARVAAAAATAAVVVAVSGWLVPALVAGIGAWIAVSAWQRRIAGRVDDVARTDALASWIENLRDVLVAGDQPVGAIQATVTTCPPAIHPQVRRLAAGLGRQEPDSVFRRFADELDDPLGDLVAAGLLIAVRRGARTAAVLSALAEQARRQADRRRLVAAERAPVQREVTLVTVIMGSLVIGLLLFGRAEYLEPYDSAGGQLFLGVVLVSYSLLLVRVQRLGRAQRPGRFLTAGDPRTAPAATAGNPIAGAVAAGEDGRL